ncbi:MAG: putative Na+/H+ antiporter [Bdellovibrionota bacterium]|nr:putative Na+/H+ antiporter [Bdellovibrionota bacterium]
MSSGMNPTTIQLVGTILFALAVIHTFLVSKFEHIAHKYPEGSVGENFFHFMGEVEAVFGMWAAVFIVFYTAINGFTVYGEDGHHLVGGAVHFLEQMAADNKFVEPAFVFVIMCMAGTKPVIELAEKIIGIAAKILPFSGKMSFYISALILGPLLGSFITEPAAMTVTALILLKGFYGPETSTKFKYATLGLLFVNISIGGTLTHFAAPPVLMVAGKWGWGMSHMLGHYGYKAAIAVVISTLLIATRFKKELAGDMKFEHKGLKIPLWVTFIHLFFLVLVVKTAHHMVFFMGLFLFFLGFAAVSKEYQDEIKLKESLLVGFFLGGLVILGSQQQWWLKPILEGAGDQVLFFGATALTAITDNAALTYLGTLVQLTDSQQYYLVAGAVAGGGLTVIANAPNPAGFGILKGAFGEDGISPIGLLKSALIPTIIALICLELLPHLA